MKQYFFRKTLLSLFVSVQKGLENTGGDGWLKDDWLKGKVNLDKHFRKMMTEFLERRRLTRSLILKKHRTKKRILFRLFAFVYLACLIVSQAATPTTAYFTKTSTTEGQLEAGETFSLVEGSEQASENREKDDTGLSEDADQEDKAEDELKDGAGSDSQMDDEEESLKAEKEVELDAGIKNSNKTGKDEDVGEQPDDQGEDTDENDF